MHRVSARHLSLVVMVLALASGRGANAQNIRDDFYVTNGRVESTALSGNTLYLGGTFTQVGPFTGTGVVIDSTTGLPLVIPKVTGVVHDVEPDGSGGWFIAGNISAVGGVARNKMAHILADGTVDAWNPGPDFTPTCLAVSGGIVYVGGAFLNIGGLPRGGIAAVDAATGLVTAWNPGPPGAQVFSVEVKFGAVFVGGLFNTMGSEPRMNLAALDPATGFALPWNPGTNGPVLDLAISGLTAYAAGQFTTAGGQSRNGLAAIDLITGLARSWNPNPNGSGSSRLAVADNTVYVTGSFTTIGGQSRNTLAALDDATGLATAWNPNPAGTAGALRVSGPILYVGGVFTAIGGQSRSNLAALDRATGLATAWNPNANANVRCFALGAGRVFAAGSLTSLGGQFRNHIAAIDATTGVVSPWNPDADGTTVAALAVTGSTVYAGGDFTQIGGQGRLGIAELSAATGLATAWDPHATGGGVRAILPAPGVVYVGGEFTEIGWSSRLRIAALDPATGLATAWNPIVDAGTRVDALAAAGNTIYAGGAFTMIGGQPRNRIAALDATSGLATPWNPNANGTTVRALALSGSTVYAGGDFTMIGGQTRNRIAALDAGTGLATAWNPNASSTVRALAPGGAVVYAGGDFATIGGQARARIAALDAATGLATSWNVPFRASIFTLAVNGTAVFAGNETVNGFDPGRGITAIDVDQPPAPFNSFWDARMNIFPDAFCPWTGFDTAAPEDPALAGGILTLATSDFGENVYYEQSNLLSIPQNFTIAARLRLVSESHGDGNPRRGVAIHFTVAPDTSNVLCIEHDRVFLWSAIGVQGPTAVVDTDDAFHDYRIEVQNHQAIQVYQDNVLILTGTMTVSSANVDYPYIWWGDGTANASAVSQWTSFAHNGSTSACGSVSAVEDPGRPRADGPMVSIRAYPNPSRGPLALAIVAAEPPVGEAELLVHDVTGRLVARLPVGTLAAGRTTLAWDGRDARGRAVSGGMYALRLVSGGTVIGTGRVMILR